MLWASLRELVEEGRLGSLTLQASRAAVRAALGEPDLCSEKLKGGGQPRIWKYGDIEFHFGDDDTLELIHTDTFRKFPRGGRKLRLDPWIFSHSLASEVLIGACQHLHLPCREFIIPGWDESGERRFLVGVGVEVVFDTPERGKRDQLRVVSYSVHRWSFRKFL